MGWGGTLELELDEESEGGHMVRRSAAGGSGWFSVSALLIWEHLHGQVRQTEVIDFGSESESNWSVPIWSAKPDHRLHISETPSTGTFHSPSIQSTLSSVK